MIRATLTAISLVISVVLISAALLAGTETSMGNLLINLGTEFFGIMVTVAVVEWLFERRRLQDRGRELAWSILHSLEKSIWVWQGGPRGLGTEELLGLISAASMDDPMADCTKTLLLNLGNQGKEAIDKESKALKSIPGLPSAVKELISLRSLRDGGSVMSNRMVTEILESTGRGIAGVLGLPTQKLPSALIRYRDSGLEAQEDRYFDIRQAEV